jgi:hypothetical protein
MEENREAKFHLLLAITVSPVILTKNYQKKFQKQKCLISTWASHGSMGVEKLSVSPQYYQSGLNHCAI